MPVLDAGHYYFAHLIELTIIGYHPATDDSLHSGGKLLMSTARYICFRCQRTSTDGNLWCPEVDCPAEKAPYLLTKGDRIGQIEVESLIAFLPGASIYRATYNEQDCFLKVANPGQTNIDYLRREAVFYRHLAPDIESDDDTDTILPAWIPHETSKPGRAASETEAYGQMRHFFLLAYHEGNLLRDMLLDNPQPYHKHVGWLLISLGDFLSKLRGMSFSFTDQLTDPDEKELFNAYNKTDTLLHLNVTPSTVYVTEDANGAPKALLLDMGPGLCEGYQPTIRDTHKWLPFIEPAYRPREFIQSQSATLTTHTQVYQLALLGYQMYAGKAPFGDLFIGDERLHQLLLNERFQVERTDLPGKYWKPGNRQSWTTVARILNDNLRADKARWDETILDFSNRLRKIYGNPAYEAHFSWGERFQWVSRNLAYAVTGLVVIFTVLMLVLALAGG